MFTPDELKSDRLTLSLLPYGLTCHGLTVSTATGLKRDLIIGPHDPSDHHLLKGRKFLNCVVGRYANRLPSGQVEVKGGAVLNLEGDDGVCLHGGATGLDTVEWARISVENSTLFSQFDIAQGASASAIYRYVSSDGDDGFPLGLEVEGLSTVSPGQGGSAGKVTVVLRAKIIEEGADEEALNKGTPVNLTVHWGFNLSNFSTEDVKDHKMYINADATPALDGKMLATGELKEIKKGDALDFRSSGPDGPHRTLGQNFPADGIDHNLVFANVSTDKPQVVLTSPDDKVSLSFRTNQSTVQCYTAAGFDSRGPARKSIHDPQNVGPYSRFGAVFLEFHHPLATFLHPKYEQRAGTDTVLKRGEVYENWCEVEVKVKE